MQTIPIYQVDTFTTERFKGNPAAVCPLDAWLDDDTLLAIAAENNLSETAFYVRKKDHFEIRWFTPATEVDLCGHATLASAYVMTHFEPNVTASIALFSPRSGHLNVAVKDDVYSLDFPTDSLQEVALSEALLATTDKKPLRAFRGKTDYLLIFESQADIASMKPNLHAIAQLDARGLIVSSAGEQHDFVSRFFGPAVGVDEDPVCGSAHTTLIPYWAAALEKDQLRAYQLSKRGGELQLGLHAERVSIAGAAALYLKGEIYI